MISSIKEMNRLTSKGISNIYLKSCYKFVSRPVFGELQLAQISLNFKPSCCNLKIRGARAKTMCGFFIMLILKEVMTF